MGSTAELGFPNPELGLTHGTWMEQMPKAGSLSLSAESVSELQSQEHVAGRGFESIKHQKFDMAKFMLVAEHAGKVLELGAVMSTKAPGELAAVLRETGEQATAEIIKDFVETEQWFKQGAEVAGSLLARFRAAAANYGDPEGQGGVP